ncbi:MAG: SDR family oxidoreductase [Clostridiaceae bacterium]
MTDETYLITGAGTGFGKGIAFALADLGKDVVAGVETLSEVSMLMNEAKDKKLNLRVEKLDITNAMDRERAATWEIDVLLNNAGVSLGGSLVDIPEEILRKQFEVNVFGTLLLTQVIAKRMVKKQRGKIVFVSSVHGLIADPMSGPYCGSKYALEAFAESLKYELQEFGVEVATINPGPYLTGFNDREYESYKEWKDNPSERLFDYEKLAFPYEQFDNIKPVVKEAVKILTGKSKNYRNVVPKAFEVMVKKREKDIWDLKSDDEIGKRHEKIAKAYKMEPATTIASGIVNKIKDKLT